MQKEEIFNFQIIQNELRPEDLFLTTTVKGIKKEPHSGLLMKADTESEQDDTFFTKMIRMFPFFKNF